MRFKRPRGTPAAPAEARPGSPGPLATQVRPAGPPAGGPGPTERTRRFRARNAGAATVGAVGAGVVTLARLVMTLAALIALLIGLAIVLRDVGANSSNSIVEGIHEGANFFAGSFSGLIKSTGHPKREISIDWGIALVVYLIVGGLLARAIAGVGVG